MLNGLFDSPLPRKVATVNKRQPLGVLNRSKPISKRGQRVKLGDRIEAHLGKQDAARTGAHSQRTISDFVSVKQRDDGKRVGFQTPTRRFKSKSFKQAKLAVTQNGRNLRIDHAGSEDALSFTESHTALNTSVAKRGRPRKSTQAASADKQLKSGRRKAKVNASSVISQLYSNSKQRLSRQRMVKDDILFYF